MCSKMRWFVLLTWNRPIREQVFTALIVLFIQSELTLDLISHSGTILHSKIHFGCGRGSSCSFLVSTSSTSTTTRKLFLQKFYFSFRNAPTSIGPHQLQSGIRHFPALMHLQKLCFHSGLTLLFQQAFSICAAEP